VKRVPTVRVVNFEDKTHYPKNHLAGVWVEQLRYMGHVRVLREYTGNDAMPEVLEFEAPKGVDAEVWCQQNAERMSSFGISAVVAPKWGTTKEEHL